MSLVLGLALALASTVVLDVGYLLQQRGASTLPALRLNHPLVALRGLLSARGWVLGVGLTAVGFGLYFVALGFADISLVQSASASGVALLAVIAARWFGASLARREVIGIALATAGLLLLGLSLIGHSDEGRETASLAQVAVWCGASAVVALALLTPLARRVGSAGVMAGLAAGILFGAGDVATKGVLVTTSGVGGAVGSPLLYGLLALYGLGFVAQQLAFQRGEAVAAIGVMVAATNALPIVAGVVVFDDPLPHHPGGLLMRLGGFALAVAGSVLLARVSEGGGAPEPEPEAAPA